MIRENAWGLGTKFQKRIWGEGHKLAEVYPYVDLAAICGYCVCIAPILILCDYHTRVSAPASV